MEAGLQTSTEGYLCPVHLAAHRMPEAPAIIAPHRTYSYLEYHEHANGAAANFRKAGMSEGQVVAIALPPGVPYPILFTGLWRLGAVACPLNTRFPAQYLLDVLKRIRCRDIVVPYGASIITVQGKLFALAPKDVVEDRLTGSSTPATIPAERPTVIVLTSGSSGPPKAALIGFGNLVHNASLSNRNIRIEPGDRWLMSLPLYHVSGLGVLFRCALAGAALVFPAANESLHVSIARYGITHLSLVSTQLYRLMRDPEAVKELRRLKAILLGGGPIPESLLRRAVEEGLAVYVSYGLTEMATQVATTRPGDPIDRLLTAGRPLEPENLAIGENERILVRGPARFLGYVNGSALERPFNDQGWFVTGDTGELDAQGYLIVKGRSDYMFVSGGENVQPEEIEQHLAEAPGVLEAIVVSAPHPEFGAVPVAFLRMDAVYPLDETALREALLKCLPRYKIPKKFLPWPEDLDMAGIKPSRRMFTDRAAGLFQG